MLSDVGAVAPPPSGLDIVQGFVPESNGSTSGRNDVTGHHIGHSLTQETLHDLWGRSQPETLVFRSETS